MFSLCIPSFKILLEDQNHTIIHFAQYNGTALIYEGFYESCHLSGQSVQLPHDNQLHITSETVKAV